MNLNDKQVKALMLFSSYLYYICRSEFRDEFYEILINNLDIKDESTIVFNCEFSDAVLSDYQKYFYIAYKVECKLYPSLFGISLNEVHSHFKSEWLNYDSPEVIKEDGFHRDSDKFKGLRIKWEINLDRIVTDLYN